MRRRRRRPRQACGGLAALTLLLAQTSILAAEASQTPAAKAPEAPGHGLFAKRCTFLVRLGLPESYP